jgi:glycosyltransferase involved in cell wall biosynthesis
MTSLDQSQLKLAVYSSDVWGHVCPVVRLTGPAEFSGLAVYKGNDWTNGALTFSLEPIAQADLVVILRDFPRFITEYRQVVNQARSLGKKIVYGIDDLLIELPEGHPDAVHYRAARYLILGAILEADAVFVTTPPLRDELAKYNPRVHILPNYLHDRIWHLPAPAVHNSGSPVVIGYQGGMGHLPDLEMITPALVSVLQRYGSQVKLKFWGAMPPTALRDWPNVEWLNVGLVDYAQFVQYFQAQECDLCIAPIADHLFNACKSPLKYLEYSAMALPGIYSRVAPYESVVTHGVDGLLVGDVQEWEQALVHLIEDPALRARLGQAAQDTVRQHWLLSEHAHEWNQFFDRIMAEPVPARMPPELAEVVQASQRWSISMDQTLAAQSTEFAETTRRNAYESEQKILELQTHLSNIQGSLGWRLLMRAHRIADKFIPADKPHGRIVRSGLRLLKGPRRKQKPQAAFIPQNGESLYVVNGNTSSPLLVQLRAAASLASPGISLLLPCGTGLAQVDETAARDWLNRQTYNDVEIIPWDVSSDPAELLPRLRGKYTCAASYDLLQHSPTYLETNLIALESEGLAFTVNALGSAEWMIDRLKAGSLPGSTINPLLRQVVRTDCLVNSLQPDLSHLAAQAGDYPWVAGKLIVHTSGKMDHHTALPYNQNLVVSAVTLLGNYIVASPFGRGLPPAMIPHPVYDVDQVLPKTPLPSDQPTVFVVMPFLAVGGAETVHLHVLRCLQPKARFVIITFEPHASALGTTVEEFRAITPYIYTLPDYLLYHLNFSLMRYLIERYQPQALYVANGATWIYDALADLRKLYPQMLVANQVYDHQAGWINRYDAQLVRQIDAHISINDLIDKAYLEAGARPEQVFHIENGVDTGYFDPGCYSSAEVDAIKARLGLPAGRKVVTMMGRLHPQKRPVDFIEIARRCGDDPELIFLMVGDGPLGDTVNNLLAQSPLPNFYRRTFYKPSRDIFAISDVTVLTSEYEGMPMVVLEAQSMGKPVVATDVGNIRQVLEKTGGGQSVARVGDIAGLVSAIRQTLSQPPAPEGIRQAVCEQYSLQQMADGYAKALRLK